MTPARRADARRFADALPRPRNALSATLLAALLFALPVGAQPGPPGGFGAMGPTAVGVVTLETADVPYVRTLPGRAVASAEADVRPRVSGMVEEILFAAGDRLAVGDPMFRIEDASYRAALASAQAALASAVAAAETANATVARYTSLQGSAITAADLQSAVSSATAAEASRAAAEAALAVAQLDLDRTRITAPIAGIAGLPDVSVGTLVTANQTDALATVTRLDPIYIDVSESSAAMLRTRERIDAGELRPGDRLGIALTLEDGRRYGGEGIWVAPGNSVSATTGTIDFRLQFDNPDRLILPGQFLRVALTLGSTPAILVPQRATGRASDGTLTAFRVEETEAGLVARQVELTSTGSYSNAWVVTAGVEPGDRLIVDGLSNLTDGAVVAPVAVSINDQGVVIAAEPAQGN